MVQQIVLWVLIQSPALRKISFLVAVPETVVVRLLVLAGGTGSRRVLRPISYSLFVCSSPNPTTKMGPPFRSWILRSWFYYLYLTCGHPRFIIVVLKQLQKCCCLFLPLLASSGSTLPLGSEALSAISSHFWYESVLHTFWLDALDFRWAGLLIWGCDYSLWLYSTSCSSPGCFSSLDRGVIFYRKVFLVHFASIWVQSVQGRKDPTQLGLSCCDSHV